MTRVLTIVLLASVLFRSQAQPITDSLALSAFMDGVMKTHLRDKHIAGATLSIVKDGKILLAKGYGFSDEKNQIPVSPDSTLFRVGSISKVFTWISVMQLVSQGKLDLDEDINTYLKDFKIPPTFPKPITLKHLMTHTPGFEDLVIGLFGKDSTSMRPLGQVLAEQIPARVRPPGTQASYSNHGTGMAAYIVEVVSGMSFNDYVEKNILGPLGMSRTTFRQPLPSDISPLLSKGYKYGGGVYREKPLEFVPLYPVGAASASATDMVKFMRMLMENGKLGTAVILDSATMALMSSPAHQHSPAVNPMRHGLIDMSRDSVNCIGHGGDTFWFHSMMALFPESQLGVFLSFNTDTGGGVSGAVLDEFITRYFTGPQLSKAIKLSRDQLQKFTGKYRANRHAYNDMTSVASMLSDAVITLEDSTSLRFTSGENVRILVPIDSLTFREKNKERVFAFQKNEDGKIAHMFLGSTPIVALYKVTGLKSADLHMFIFFASIVTGIVVLIFWPFVAWSRYGYVSHRMTKPMPVGCRLVAWMNFFLLLIFYAGVGMMANEDTIVNGIPTSLKILLWVPFINMVLTLSMIIWMFRVIATKYHRVVSRFYYFLITVVAVAAFWQLYYWNLIGPRY